jgi:hypothetical protein
MNTFQSTILKLFFLSLLSTTAFAANDGLPTASSVIGNNIQSIIALEGTEIASSSHLSSTKNEQNSVIDATRLNYTFDVPSPQMSLFEGVQLKTDLSATYLKTNTKYSGEDFNALEKDKNYLISAGIRAYKELNNGFYITLGSKAFYAQTENKMDFGKDTESQAFFADLNNLYINTTIQSLSLQANANLGWRKNFGDSGQFGVFAQSDLSPLISKSVGVENDSQNFTKLSGIFATKVGAEYTSPWMIEGKPIAFIASYKRSEYLGSITPLDSSYLNQYSIEAFRLKNRNFQFLDGIGLKLDYLDNGVYTGYALGAKLYF